MNSSRRWNVSCAKSAGTGERTGEMNFVDIAIILLLGLAAAHGVTQGAALQVLSFGGFWIGLLLGAALAPVISKIAGNSPMASAFVSLITFFGCAVIGGGAGRYLGTHAWSALRRMKLGPADAGLGAIVAVVAALFAIWLVAVLLTGGPTKGVARAMNRSVIVRTLVAKLPPAPSVFSRLQALIASTPFPRVFSGLEPVPAGPVPVPGGAVIQNAVKNAGNSTVRIVGVGCGGVQTGSGFVVSSNLVLTNAHVVAGIQSPEVQDSAGGHRSTPVLFDPELDVAVLRTNIHDPVLHLDPSDVPRGQGGAVLGYPNGGKFDAEAAAVLRKFIATGRDIYGRNLTQRDVYQMQALIRPGNSGGPFVRQDGEVLGVVFATSTTENDVGYALTSAEVIPRVNQAKSSGPVSTGQCTQ
jgi:S1-C subfamily serine protease